MSESTAIQSFEKYFAEALEEVKPVLQRIIVYGAVASHLHRKSLGIGPAEMARQLHIPTRRYRSFEAQRLGRKW